MISDAKQLGSNHLKNSGVFWPEPMRDSGQDSLPFDLVVHGNAISAARTFLRAADTSEKIRLGAFDTKIVAGEWS